MMCHGRMPSGASIHHLSNGGDNNGRNGPAAEHGVAAERLDRGDFGIQKHYNVVPIYQCGTFQPPAERQTVIRTSG